jgi:hydrogenase 3 maturation protease
MNADRPAQAGGRRGSTCAHRRIPGKEARNESPFTLHSSPFLILGVGNRMRGDDAIGSLAGEHFVQEGRIPAIDCSVAPENYLGRVIEAHPSELILIDACDFGGEPGEVRIIDEAEFERIAYGLLLTHTMPLTLLAALVEKEIQCRIRLIGIQPQSVMFGEEISEPVKRALPKVLALVRELTASP